MDRDDLPDHVPSVGQLVHVRARTWLVDELLPPALPGQTYRVRLSCADDDAQGQTLELLWDYELDRQIVGDPNWSDLATRGFDPPDRFAAFLHTLRWNCVTATDPTLFQAPFRAGIKIDAYQMEPLRKALRLPRVNLFIADDTGLGKTIEAGLIMRELLLRKKVRTVVVAAPPSVLEQWQAELEERFGLLFELLDRAYLARMRRERGFGVNPWRTHSRFLVSHRLLVDPGYADPLREWLGSFLPGSLLVLDEAHHAAPSSGGRYGIESAFTRAIRDLAGRFEHRLFLSATPHNGHSNSFSTLLELLDPVRFTRGVKVRGRKALEEVMVRRLKEDIRFNILSQAIEGTDRADERIEVIDGLTSSTRRQEIQRRFNSDPAQEPLRILLATDAAREGLNFQAHCADLFHFDLPWNPGRIEQRNGRIDRKLQPQPEVRCHYFVLPQRVEDRVLEVLVRKTETIKREIGSLSQVIDDDIERRLRQGIRHRDVAVLVQELDQADLETERRQRVTEELEVAREREQELHAQITRCQSLLERSKRWTGFAEAPFRQALSCALELLGALPLQPTSAVHGQEAWLVPALHARTAADPSWHATLDTLRAPRAATQSLTDWRREAAIRPVLFADAGVLTDETVHLHLEHRVAQRLLARFRAQGFTEDLSRACLFQSSDAIPRIVLLGRLSLYGQGAERLHEELVAVTARWLDPTQRTGPLMPYGRDGETRTLQLLDETLRQARLQTPGSVTQRRLLESAAADITDLQPHLTPRAEQAAAVAIEQLRQRGEQEANDLRTAIEQQERRVREQLERSRGEYVQLTLAYSPEERRQFERDRRAWEQRLVRFAEELATEPRRVQDFYQVRARRVEPVGLIYLWPESN